MHTFKNQLREWRLVIVALASAAVCSILLGGWSLGRPASDAAAISPEDRPAIAGPRWVPALFERPPASAKEQAHARLEAAGMTLDGPSFVKAIATGHQPLIDLFLAAGVDVNAPAEAGRTALLVSAAQGRWPLFEQLLAKGANPNLADAQGVTPLMVAAAANRGPEVDTLLARGAALEPVDSEGRTAADYALTGKNLASFPKLLGPAADEELLDQAWETGDWRFIEPVLSRQTEPLPWSTPARAALLQALGERDAVRTKLLLSKYAGAPAAEDRAQPLLAWLVRDNQIESFRFLLECGADPDTALNSPVEKVFNQTISQEPLRSYLNSEPGMTTLMLAAGLSRPDFVQALLEKGAKRGLTTTRYKLPALTFAAETSSPESLQLLLGGSPKPEQVRIEISLASQRATVYREGRSVITTPVSTGRPGFATPSGDFVITDKHLEHKSTIYKAEMPFFMRLNCRDFGMHAGVVPGHPASHGCIRLPGEMARRLFKEIPVGTLVSIRQ